MRDSKFCASTVFLRRFDAAADQARFDGNAFFHAQALQQLGDPLLGEDAHQVIFEREIETGGAGIALAAGAAAKLIVDAARLVALGAENMQAAGGDDFVVLFVGFLLVAVQDFGPMVGGDAIFLAFVVPDGALGFVNVHLNFALSGAQGLGQAFLQALALGHEFRIAAQQNIGAAARHVGGNGDGVLCARPGPRFRLRARAAWRSEPSA